MQCGINLKTGNVSRFVSLFCALNLFFNPIFNLSIFVAGKPHRGLPVVYHVMKESRSETFHV